MAEREEARRRIESIERLIREMEKLPDPDVVSLCKQLVQSLMDLHGSGLERLLEIVHRSGDGGTQVIDELGRDELVSSLLLLYGLHPLDLRSRILQALEKSRPSLRLHGGDVELVDLSDTGSVTVRLEASGHSCRSSAATLQTTVEEAIYAAAPDVTAIVVEGGAQEPATVVGFVPLASLQGNGNGHVLHDDLVPLLKEDATAEVAVPSTLQGSAR